jgi:hypothetical protein
LTSAVQLLSKASGQNYLVCNLMVVYQQYFGGGDLNNITVVGHEN